MTTKTEDPPVDPLAAFSGEQERLLAQTITDQTGVVPEVVTTEGGRVLRFWIRDTDDEAVHRDIDLSNLHPKEGVKHALRDAVRVARLDHKGGPIVKFFADWAKKALLNAEAPIADVAPAEPPAAQVAQRRASTIRLAGRRTRASAFLRADPGRFIRPSLNSSKELAGAREELKNVLESNYVLARRTERDRDEIVGLRLKSYPTLVAWITLGLLLVTIFVVGYAISQVPEIPEPTVCEPTVCEPVAAAPGVGPAIPTVSNPENGYLAEDEVGMPRIVPWPDASHYPTETFNEDCRAVCAVPSPMSRGHEPGRVLVIDPAHLVCVCFHAESAWPVTRWINWEHIR